ncbi:hypothetical protein [Peribacillus frigoritolerans]|uniref:hypothetical protein n=1 Tax=Peribacillus frigoritolerans TaxID=450367 RepID=UPI0020C0C6B4|nr:hypothetical protein [Peribacillus frigoritolerans]
MPQFTHNSPKLTGNAPKLVNWLYKGVKEVEEGKDFPFVSSYWFWRVLFIVISLFIIFTTVNSFFR